MENNGEAETQAQKFEEIQSQYLSNEQLVLELLPDPAIKPYIEIMQPWMQKFSDDLDIWLSKIVEETVRRLDLSCL